MKRNQEDLRFAAALSYSDKNSWAAKDIFNLLTQHGFSVYCYDYQADYAHGFLRSQLRSIYIDSILNVILWSSPYRDQPSDSLVAMERRCISNRHVEKGDAQSLAILSLDGTPLDRDLNEVLAHDLTRVGIVGFSRILVDRLTKFQSTSEFAEHGVCHPLGTENARGQLHPCLFRINDFYESDRLNRWASLADVLVNCPTPLNTPYVYLIPSGACSPLLRHSLILKTDSQLLKKKRQLTKSFVAERIGHEIPGYWFPMRVGAVEKVEVATVYSSAYDMFLNTRLQQENR